MKTTNAGGDAKQIAVGDTTYVKNGESWEETDKPTTAIADERTAINYTPYRAPDTIDTADGTYEYADDLDGLKLMTHNTYTFIDDIYESDDEGQPTTTIDPEYADDEDLYNIRRTYEFASGTTMSDGEDEYDVDKLVIYLSSQVERQQIEGSDPPEYEIKPIGNEYMLSCMAYGSKSSDKTVQWLSVFTNME